MVDKCWPSKRCYTLQFHYLDFLFPAKAGCTGCTACCTISFPCAEISLGTFSSKQQQFLQSDRFDLRTLARDEDERGQKRGADDDGTERKASELLGGVCLVKITRRNKKSIF